MTDREALYRSILSNPGDDTPRLVYADWLEENGREEEAEFIRVECRLEFLSPADSDYPDLLDQQEDLRLWLTTHVPGPKLRLPAGLRVADGPEWWRRTRRGFPRFLEFDGSRRTGLKPIRALAAALGKAFAILPTRWLVVRFLTTEQFAELFNQPIIAGLDRLTIQNVPREEPQDEIAQLVASCGYLRHLTGLALDSSIGNAGIEALAKSYILGGIQRLALEPARLTRDAIRALLSTKWFRELSELSLKDNCPNEVFEELFGREPYQNLRSLELSDNDFPESTWRAFAQSRAFSALAELNLSRTDMSGARIEQLSTAKLPRLSALDLSSSAIGNDGAAILARAAGNENLTRLNLSANNLGPSGIADIARCPRLSRLKHLDLSLNFLGPRCLHALANNSVLAGLTRLSLRSRGEKSRYLSPADFERFLRELHRPKLRSLDLTGQPVGPRAARMLANKKFQSLTRLKLSGCKLTDSAVAALLKAPALQNLIELDLSHNNLKTGVEPLTDQNTLPKLSQGWLHVNRIDPAVARKLSRRPGVSI